MKYYLVGYMYCGKSTFGRRLADEKGMEFLDLDRAFEERFHYTVPRFFNQFGEKAFRQLATGGGTPCHSGNMDFILEHGTAVYIRMGVDDIVERALRSRNPRPKLHGLPEAELRPIIEAQRKEREGVYLRAQIIIDGKNPVLP